MTLTLIRSFLPVSIAGLLICYAVTVNSQGPTSREDEVAIAPKPTSKRLSGTPGSVGASER